MAPRRIMTKYFYSIKVLKVIDGDTIDAEVDLGFHIKVKKRIRLHGINAPETRLQSKIKNLEERKAEKSRGLIAKARLREICDNNGVLVESVGLGKYGRLLGVLYTEGEGSRININNLLLKEGHATEYMK
jgi:micrococcal nuclease